jgi:signal transduction histidine kinase
MPSRVRDWAGRTSLRTRLTLWNALVVLLMTAATLVAARFVARATLYDDADAELRAGAREVVMAIQDLHPDLGAVTAEMQRKAESHAQRGWFLQLLTESGTTIWKSRYCPDEVARFPPRGLDREELVVQVGPYRYVRFRLPRLGEDALHVRVGTYTTGLDDRLTGLMRSLLPVGAVLCLVTPLVGYWLARQATRPVAAILDAAARLSPTQLDDRLPLRGAGDELDQLSSTINRLLDAVAMHVERQEQFVADAAHELRGPLAALQSSIEVAIGACRGNPVEQERLVDMLDVARHLGRVANDLLLLAETGFRSGATGGIATDVAAVARQAAAMFAGVAEDRGVTLCVDADAPAVASADEGELRRVIGNLLDNAIRFTPPAGGVTLRVTTDPADRRVSVEVRDTGSGIAPGHLPHVFDRFFKADSARTHSGPIRGGGLGLAICKSLVEASGGTIAIESRLGEGTRVVLTFPGAPRAPESSRSTPGSAPARNATPLTSEGWAVSPRA